MGAGAFEKLRLLMWKNFLQQWRHKLQTVAEVLLPVLTASLVVILRNEVEPIAYSGRTYPPIPAYSLEFSRNVITPMDYSKLSIAYSPYSPILEQTIRRAIFRLMEQNIENILPEENITRNSTTRAVQKADTILYLQSFLTLTAYNDSGQLNDVYLPLDAIRQVLAAVQFSDSLYGATELPADIEYELRFPARPRLNFFFRRGGWSWRTDMVFPVYLSAGPRFPWSWEGGNDPGYVNEMFIALQHAISTELIRDKAPSAAAIPVNIQRFPHPPYNTDILIDILHFLFPMLIMMSFTYTAVSTVRFVAREKELQLKESMKIMGLPTWLHWTAWFLKQFLFLLITIAIVVFILKMEWYQTELGLTGYSIFTTTSWTVLFMFMALYMACTIFFCFMVSGLFAKASTAALFCSVFWFLTYVPSLILMTENRASFASKLFSCLSLNSAMALGFQQILASEGTNRGMNWSEFFTAFSEDDDFLFGYVLLMLLLDCALYMLLALYFEQVFPGSSGVPQPWYFPVKPAFWFPDTFGNEPKNYTPSEENSRIIRERNPTGHKVGVEIQNLTKVFNNQAAVDNLNLNIYEDQISVLLGHNGAGKTTTISMLTGMIPPSSGTAILAGYNISAHMNDARSSLGICPQHNILFTDLTVREHLQFFSRLKGLKDENLIIDVENIIDKLELVPKADTVAGALSGGQKRRLCVGVALCGRPRVVLLDEPTSGMDPASRRALWDLLQREKKGRAMILTTHFMDEADILGDRIAIMARGRLQCVGSPFFLKQQFGGGYKLVLVKEEFCRTTACMELLKKHIPEVELHSDRGSELFYSLPNEHSHKFRNMLHDLEKNQTALGVRSYGLTPSTLEDVFMKVGSDTSSIEEDADNSDTETSNIVSEGSSKRSDLEGASTEYLYHSEMRITGLQLLSNHILAMWLKRALVVWRDWKLSLLQIMIPLLITFISIMVVQYTSTMRSESPPYHLTISEGYINTETFVSQNGTLETSGPSHLALEAFKALFEDSGPTNKTMLDIGDSSIEEYYLDKGSVLSEMARMRFRNVIGATFSADSVTAWFSNFGYHDVAVSLATMHNALLHAYAPEANIRVVNHPIRLNTANQVNLELLNSILAMQLSNSIGTSMAIVCSFFVIFYVKERVSRAKLLQKSSGIQPIVMWGAAAIFDWLWFMIICLGVIFTFLVMRVEGFSSFAEMGRGYLVLMVFGAAMLPVHYLASFLITGPASGFVLAYFINTFLGIIGSMFVDALKTPGLTTEDMAEAFDMVLQFFPTYAMVNIFRQLTNIGLTESSCSEVCITMSEYYPMVDCNMQAICNAGIQLCCMSENPYFLWEEPGVLKYIVCMLVSCVVFWTILLIIEYRLLDKVLNCSRAVPPLLDLTTEDSDVVAETHHVQQIGVAKLPQYNLVCQDLTKFYGKHLAVNQVSFSVKAGECFGLLGVNGAGKTSTFKMLTGDVAISSGDAFVRGHSVRGSIKRVQQHLGYCPQFDALFEELTGRETLRLYALLRGLRAEQAAARALELAGALGLLRHLDKRVGQYSGGNKRKLSTAVALLGRAALLYLDEPTTGVDPAAKRRVWRAVLGATAAGRSVLLTTHSMEECEALCSRLAVMVDGRFRCFGSLQHLKNKFSQGYILNVKLKPEDDIAARDASMTIIKQYITENFTDAKLMECYQGLLTYYLGDRGAAWSHMFGLMETAKRQLPIEDYTISQTTLEQVFLQFTKHQQHT